MTLKLIELKDEELVVKIFKGKKCQVRVFKYKEVNRKKCQSERKME